MTLTFEEETHTYRKNGRKVPSVTQIIKPLYADLRFVDKDLLEYKSDLGKAVHKTIELYALDDLDESSVVSPVLEYFKQYLKFESESGFKALHPEALVYSALGYAGQVDLIGTLHKKLVLMDLKTTATISSAVALQTMAYKKAWEEENGRVIQERYALRLAPDKYRLHKFSNDGSDLAGFVGFLSAYRWCEANGKQFNEVG